MEIQQHTNAASVHPDLANCLNLVSWSENLFSQEQWGKELPERQLFLCWTEISTLLVLHFFKRNVLKKIAKKDHFANASVFKVGPFLSHSAWEATVGVFVGVKAGSDTWHWCHIINTTCDRICRAQHSSAETPQSSLASYWSESDVLFAQDTKEIICLEKCSNTVMLWMRLNLVSVRSVASGSWHPKGSQLRHK